MAEASEGTRDQWEQRQHERGLKSLREILRRVTRGNLFVVSLNFDYKMDGSGWRLVVHFRERE